MKDHLNLDELESQRVKVVKQLEEMVRKKAPISEFKRVESYLRLIDRRIEAAKK